MTVFALLPPTDLSLFEAARIGKVVTHVEGDVRDLAALTDAVSHLAAQPLVRLFHEQPVETCAPT